MSNWKDGVANNRNREGEGHSDGGGIQDALNVRCLLDTQVTVSSTQLPAEVWRDIWAGAIGR